MHDDGVSDHVGGVREGLLEVGGAELWNDLRCVGAEFRMHHVAVGVAGRVDVEHRILRLDLHVDQLDGVLGEVAILGDDDGDGVADI